MKIDHDIPVRTLRAHDKDLEDVSPSIRKGLGDQGTKSHLIPGILEDDHAMHIACNGLGKFPRWKQILTQVQDRNVSMMGFSCKEIQHAFIVPSFVHEIIQDQHPPWRKPCLKIGDFRDSFVKLDALTFHAIEPGLPYGATAGFDSTHCRGLPSLILYLYDLTIYVGQDTHTVSTGYVFFNS